MTPRSRANLSFFARARREARRYGDDPWVFLRELVQNSRDAAASRIDFIVSESDGSQYISCTDDGSGMTRAHMERYLFRLFASDKEDQEDLIGYFGVGFWSILLFRPDRIVIESRRGSRGHAFEVISRSDTVAETQCRLSHQGTRITLVRHSPSHDKADGSFVSLVGRRLSYFAAHVRPLPGAGHVALLLNSQRLDKPFDRPEYLARALRDPEFDGMIGFGKRPYVRIYQGGLLVREAGSLNDLLPNRESTGTAFEEGLYPQISVNCDRLRLLMDRKGIFEDRHLTRLVDACESALHGMHRTLLRRSFPIDLRNGWLLLRGSLAFRLIWLPFFLVPILVLAVIYVWPSHQPLTPSRLSFRPHPLADLGPTQPSTTRSIDTIGRALHGTVIDDWQVNGPKWDLKTDSSQELLLQIGVLTGFDPRWGFALEPLKPSRPYPDVAPASDSIGVSLSLSGAQSELVIPHPPGGQVIAGSIRLNERVAGSIFEDDFGQPILVHQEPLRGLLTYRVRLPGGVTRSAAQAQIPPMPPDLPQNVTAFLETIAHLDESSRRRAISQFVIDHFTYSRDPNAIDFADPTPWITKVWKRRAGDCDVVNGFHVLMLRAAGIPAHLAIGLVTRGADPVPTLHAWTMVLDGDWKHIDVTQAVASQDPESAGSQSPLTSQWPAPVTGQSHSSNRHNRPLTGAVDPQPTSFQLSKVLLWSGLGLAAVSLCVGLLVARTRRQRLPSLDPGYLEILMQRSIRENNQDDTLNLRYRPLFSTIGGGRVSLMALENWTRDAPLMSASPESRMTATVQFKRRILNKNCQNLKSLKDFLPPVVDLDDYAFMLQDRAIPRYLRKTQEFLSSLDPGLQLHVKDGGRSLEEVIIPFQDNRLGRVHFIIGSDCPPLLEAAGLYERRPDLATFGIVEWLLTHTTTYWRIRDTMLRRWARDISAHHTRMDRNAPK